MTASGERNAIGESVILICGVVRNCGETLERTLAALRAAAGRFREIRALVVESDSTDNTRKVIDRLCSNGEMRAILLGDLRGTMPLRTQRIARCRNRLVQEVRSGSCADVDYVLVADFDGLNSAVTRSAIESAWQCREPWDVVTANQTGKYYDIWALRHPVWCPGDCWEDYRYLRRLFGDEASFRAAVGSRQMRLPPSAGLIEVDSAFGGLGIYAREAFCVGTYSGVTDAGEEVCEHVSFHADLRARGYRIFINPALLNRTPDEHTSRVGPLRRFAARLSRVFARGRSPR